jgi:hypothetical protein
MDKDKLRVLPKITTLHKTYLHNTDNYFLGVPPSGSGFPLQVLARSCVGQHLSVASFNMKFHQPTPNKPRSLWAFRFNPSRTLFTNVFKTPTAIFKDTTHIQRQRCLCYDISLS